MKKAIFLILACLICHDIYSEECAERKTIIITGATGELGQAAARLMAKEHDLILTGRDENKLNKLQKELQERCKGRYDICSLDFTQKSSIESYKNYLQEADLAIDGIVLITPRPHFFGKPIFQEEALWLEVIQSTFTGPLEVLKETIPFLSQQSSVVVIAGTTSIQLQPQYGPACVIRRMWTTYVKALSHQLGPQGVRVNAISPGVVLTEYHQERIQKKAAQNQMSYEETLQKEVESIPLKRHAEPEEVAQAVRFLLTGDSSFVNGTNLILDGGYTVSY